MRCISAEVEGCSRARRASWLEGLRAAFSSHPFQHERRMEGGMRAATPSQGEQGRGGLSAPETSLLGKAQSTLQVLIDGPSQLIAV